MKRLIYSSKQPVYAMAIINPKLCEQLSIQVEVEQRSEGLIPHIHVYLDHTRNPKNCVYVRLDKAEYSNHHNEDNPLRFNKKQKREFIKVMTSPWKKSFIQSNSSDEVKVATGYEAAVNTWIDTFGETVQFEYTDDGFPKMPDYASNL